MSDSRTPSSGGPPIDHAWVLEHLAPYWAGLLEGADHERIESHLATCEACRRAWEAQSSLAPVTPGTEAHVPAALLADWERQQRMLRGLERATIRHHLERCDDCRRDLLAMGHEPVLEFVAALEPDGLMPRAPGPGSTARATTRPSLVDDARERLHRLNWALGGWAAIATAAAAVMVFVMIRGGAPGPGDSLPPPGFGGPGTTSVTTGTFPAFETGATLVLAPGAEGVAPVALMPAGAARRVIALQLKGLAGSVGDSLTFVLESREKPVLRQSLHATPADDSMLVVFLRAAPAALPPGSYRIRVGLGAGEKTYVFRIAEP